MASFTSWQPEVQVLLPMSSSPRVKQKSHHKFKAKKPQIP